MDYSTEYNRQLINSINEYWSDEIKKCTNNIAVLMAVHKSIQKLYDVQQALHGGERALARKLAGALDKYVRSAIPESIWEFMHHKTPSK